jgi:hypothetical protein
MVLIISSTALASLAHVRYFTQDLSYESDTCITLINMLRIPSTNLNLGQR